MRGHRPAAHEWGKRAERASLRGSTHEEEICEVGDARAARHGGTTRGESDQAGGKQ